MQNLIKFAACENRTRVTFFVIPRHSDSVILRL